MESNECWFEDIDTSCPYCDEGYMNFEDLDESAQRAIAVAFVKEYYATQLEELFEERADPDNEDGDLHDVPSWAEFSDTDDEKYAKRFFDFCWEFYENEVLDDSEVVDWYDGNREIHEHWCEECTDGRFEIMWNTGFEVSVRGDFDTARKKAWEHGFLLVEYPPQSRDYWLLAGGCGYDFSWQLAYCRWKVQGWLSPDERANVLGTGGHVFLHGEALQEFLAYLKTYLPTPADGLREWSYAQQKVMDIEVYANDSKRDKYKNGLAKHPKLDVTLSQLSYMVFIRVLPKMDVVSALKKRLHEETGLASWELLAGAITAVCKPDSPVDVRHIARIVQGVLGDAVEVRVREIWHGEVDYIEPPLEKETA